METLSHKELVMSRTDYRTRVIPCSVYVDGCETAVVVKGRGRRPSQTIRVWLDKNRAGWAVARYTFVRECDGQLCDGTLYA